MSFDLNPRTTFSVIPQQRSMTLSDGSAYGCYMRYSLVDGDGTVLISSDNEKELRDAKEVLNSLTSAFKRMEVCIAGLRAENAELKMRAGNK